MELALRLRNGLCHDGMRGELVKLDAVIILIHCSMPRVDANIRFFLKGVGISLEICFNI